MPCDQRIETSRKARRPHFFHSARRKDLGKRTDKISFCLSLAFRCGNAPRSWAGRLPCRGDGEQNGKVRCTIPQKGDGSRRMALPPMGEIHVHESDL